MATLNAPSYNHPSLERREAGVVYRSASVTPTATQYETNDQVVNFFKLPKGAKIVPNSFFLKSAATEADTPACVFDLELYDTTGTTAYKLIDGLALSSGTVTAFGHTATLGSQTAYIDVVTDDDYWVVRVWVDVPGDSTKVTTGALSCGIAYTLDLEPGQ